MSTAKAIWVPGPAGEGSGLGSDPRNTAKTGAAQIVSRKKGPKGMQNDRFGESFLMRLCVFSNNLFFLEIEVPVQRNHCF